MPVPETAFTSVRPVVHVDGEPRDDLQDALTGLVINQPLSGFSHAELKLVNWGLTGGGDAPGFVLQDLALGARIEVFAGPEREARVFDGEITGIEERYGDGAPQLHVLAQDRLHRLARARHNRVFENQSPDDIVSTIAQDSGLTADAGMSSATATWHQLNESDLAFLMRLAGHFDTAVRLVDEQIRSRPEEADPAPIVLSAQDSALRVRLLADLNHQPSRSRVLGFNAGTDEAVAGGTRQHSATTTGTTAADLLGRLGWTAEEIVPRPFARSQGEADAYAQAHFDRLARRFISGDIHCTGEATMRVGRQIELDGVSERLRGAYHVVHCVHRFDSVEGFETHLKVNRADWGG